MSRIKELDLNNEERSNRSEMTQGEVLSIFDD